MLKPSFGERKEDEKQPELSICYVTGTKETSVPSVLLSLRDDTVSQGALIVHPADEEMSSEGWKHLPKITNNQAAELTFQAAVFSRRPHSYRSTWSLAPDVPGNHSTLAVAPACSKDLLCDLGPITPLSGSVSLAMK
jgi:hypothetical protein